VEEEEETVATVDVATAIVVDVVVDEENLAIAIGRAGQNVVAFGGDRAVRERRRHEDRGREAQRRGGGSARRPERARRRREREGGERPVPATRQERGEERACREESPRIGQQLLWRRSRKVR